MWELLQLQHYMDSASREVKELQIRKPRLALWKIPQNEHLIYCNTRLQCVLCLSEAPRTECATLQIFGLRVDELRLSFRSQGVSWELGI